MKAIIDTGNNLPQPAISFEAYKTLAKAGIAKPEIKETTIKATSADKNEIEVLGVIEGDFTVYLGKEHATNVESFIVIKNLQHQMNIGISLLQKLDAILDFGGNTLRIGPSTIPLLKRKEEVPSPETESLSTISKDEIMDLGPTTKASNTTKVEGEIRGYTKKTTKIPPYSVSIIELKLFTNEDRLRQQDHQEPATVEIAADEQFTKENDLTFAINAITTPDKLILPVTNMSDEEIIIKKNKRIGTISILERDQSSPPPSPPPADEIKEVILDEADKEHFNRSLKEKKDFIITALKLHENKLLDEQEKIDEVTDLMLKHWRVLDSTKGKMRIGKITGVKHQIKLKPDAALSHDKPRPLNPIIKEKVENQLIKWEKQSVIQRCNGFPRHTSSLVPVMKKGGDIRTAIDFRKINAESVNQVYPLPSIQEALSSLQGNSIFSTIDGQNAYMAIELEESSKDLTGISTTIGSYFFNRLPFGLQGASQTYAQAIANALEPLPKGTALPYLDDSIVPATDFNQMMKKLDLLLRAFGETGIIINANKTKLFRDKVDYLGFEVSKRGIGTVASYITAITSIPTPTSASEMKSLLGKYAYYKRFIEDFSKITAPLIEAYVNAEKTPYKKIKITRRLEDALQTLKERITTAPILCHPDWSSEEPFILKTDFSAKALGAKICQRQRDQDGNMEERVIVYDSKRCTEIESRYQSNKGELLAFIWSCDKHRFLLYPRWFIFRTDHIALKKIKTMAFPRSLSLRWLQIITNYNFTVEYVKAELHTDVDFLSRYIGKENQTDLNHLDNHLNEDQENNEDEETNDLIIHQISTEGYDPQERITEEAFNQAQQEDEYITETKRWIELGQTPKKEELTSMPIELRQYIGIIPALRILTDGLLVRKKLPGEHPEMKELRPCIPQSLQKRIILQIHKQGGHIRLHKLFHLLLQRYWMPTPTKIIMTTIANCLTCLKKTLSVGHSLKAQKEILYSSRCTEPMEVIYLDFFGRISPPSNGFNYILSIRDSFSRFIWLLPTTDMTAATVLKTLTNNIFAYYGLPCCIKTDNHNSFTNKLLQQVCDKLQVACETTPPFNYWSNIVERFHLDLGKFLRATLENRDKESWSDRLPWICLAANSTIHSTTNLSPYFLMYGRQANIPMDIVHHKINKNLPPTEELHFNTKWGAYATRTLERLSEAFQTVKQAWKNDIDHRSRAYTGIAPERFKVGAKCLVFTPQRSKHTSDKLQSAWKGPYIISEKLSDILYKVTADPNNAVKQKPPKGIVTLSRLKLTEGKGNDENESNANDSSIDESQQMMPEHYFPHEYEALFTTSSDDLEEDRNNPPTTAMTDGGEE